MVTLSLVPSDARQIVALSELEHNRREPIGLAYNLTALFVRLKAIEHIIEQEEVWHLELEEDEYATRGGSFEFSMVGYSTDELAELRARRILLDEKLDLLFGGKGDLNRQMLENSLQGGYDSKFSVSRSPFPELYSDFGGEAEDFTEVARLYAVLLLLLTHTVSQILKLDLALLSNGTLTVDFEGSRPPHYSAEKPPLIHVRGTCDLQ